MSALYPMRIEPRFDERIWGGNYLVREMGKAAPRDRPIGESWEIYDANVVANGAYAGQTIEQVRAGMGHDLTGHVSAEAPFPFLVKFIDAREALSVQVHPDDAAARRLEGQPNGKTECWYVLRAAPGATLTYGFSRDTNPDEYERLVKEGTLESILRPLSVHPGDVVYLPAGTVHAIGAGIVLYELQQSSDVTYRIYDWNRVDASGKPRELHVDRARQVLDYHRWTRGTVRPLRQPETGRTMVIGARYFTLESVHAGTMSEFSTGGSPIGVTTLGGAVEVGCGSSSELVTLPPYSSLLVPAGAERFTVQAAAGSGEAPEVLLASVPASEDATRVELERRGFSNEEVAQFLRQFAPARDLGQGVYPGGRTA